MSIEDMEPVQMVLLDQRSIAEASGVVSGQPVAQAIHSVYQRAYTREAALIGCDHFPPLERSVAAIRRSPTDFYGVLRAGRLVGVVELDMAAPEGINIDGLVVDPDFWRRGIGRALVRGVLSLLVGETVLVSTAVANAPARRLYESCGFSEYRRWSTPDPIAMITYRLSGQPPA